MKKVRNLANTFASVSAALKVLARLEVEIKTAKSFKMLDVIARRAAAIQRFSPASANFIAAKFAGFDRAIWSREDSSLPAQAEAAK